ncbi:MAG: protoporphyrinogen/coproporphyrinogen oxidase [Thermoanaerobaculum sp.]
MKGEEQTVILGGGVTGLAAGVASGGLVLEAEDTPGGICASYYVGVRSGKVYPHLPDQEPAFRFEKGGGHWIFGGDPAVLRFISRLSPCQRYTRNSAVYFPQWDLYVPFPLQNHLAYLPKELAARALEEMVARPGNVAGVETMAQWLERAFGPTLCELFFFPFHELYTAGLYRTVAPQDPYKTPLHVPTVIRGAFGQAEPTGYNQTFIYPEQGLDHLVRGLASGCRLHTSSHVCSIDLRERAVHLADGRVVAYTNLVSTLPLDKTLILAGLTTSSNPDPATAVLVVNVGGVPGKRCPRYHWVYFPSSQSGFHRVGFYTNVAPHFRPLESTVPLAGLYIERSFLPGALPQGEDLTAAAQAMVQEVVDLGYLEEVLVVHWNTIPKAYTWRWPGSRWQQEAQQLLLENGVVPAGRFGRWTFQGIAESLAQGLLIGAAAAAIKQLTQDH